MKNAKSRDTGSEHELKHRIQICLVSASVIVVIAGAVTLFWGHVETSKLIALAAMVLAIPLFAKSHVIAGRLVASRDDYQHSNTTHNQNPLREKLVNALHRRDMKQVKKCLPYR